jgi:Acyl-CoA dehydrogenase, C-terminal domain
MMDSGELELFTQSIRQATERHTGESLDAALVELGWQDALATSPQIAVSSLFPLQGEANATSSALSYVLAAGLKVDENLTDPVILPDLGNWLAPGRLVGERLQVQGLGTIALQAHDTALVAIRVEDADTAATVSVPVSDLSIRPIGGMDPDYGLVEVTGDALTFAAAQDHQTAPWADAVALGQLALGHELVGASRKMLELAREHALERIQFGRPISSFQAVRHRLADTLVAIEAADAVLAAAWEVPSSQMATTAKALAGRGARTAARHCQQVLAGIGFTAEHPFHHYFRRVLLLDQLLGTARSLTEHFGQELLDSRKLPVLLPL